MPLAGQEYSYDTLLVEKPEPGVGVLWLNRPEKRNPISPELSREMELARLTATHSPVTLKWLKRQILGSRKVHDYEVGIEYEGVFNSRMRSYQGYTGHEDGWKGFIDEEYRPGERAPLRAPSPSAPFAQGSGTRCLPRSLPARRRDIFGLSRRRDRGSRCKSGAVPQL